jgi:hypothetical protein
MVTLWIKYNLDPALPQISGSFGINYPNITCTLQPSLVNYCTPVLTLEQVYALQSGQPHFHMVNYILDEHCLYKLKVGVLNYKYHVDAHQALKATFANLQEQINKHLDYSIQYMHSTIWSRLTF